jgi:hypothetical protein
MKRHVSEVGAQTIPQLIEVIKQVWASITVQEFANLTNSMQNRLQRVIQANGGPNGY